MKNKKILFLTTQLPFPPVSGGVIKTFYFLKHLSEENAVQLACFLKKEDKGQELEFLKEIKLQGYTGIALDIPRSIATILESYLFSTSINNYRNKHKGFKKLVNYLSKDSEILIVDHYEMFQYVPVDYKGKVILHTHNAEFALWKRMSEIQKNKLQRIILEMEAKRVKNVEAKAIKRSDLIFASPADISLYNANAISSKNFRNTFHLGDDTLLKKPRLHFKDSERSILFIGTLSWEPNINALLWFLNNVWPILKIKFFDLKFYVVGKNAHKRLSGFRSDPQIIFTGFVEDLEPFYQKSRVVVVPLKFGSGMKVKLLEAMYRGIPIVSTSVGAEGIEVEDKRDIFIEEEAQAFADKVGQLLSDQVCWENFSKNCRKIAKEKYTWEKLFGEMDQSMEELF